MSSGRGPKVLNITPEVIGLWYSICGNTSIKKFLYEITVSLFNVSQYDRINDLEKPWISHSRDGKCLRSQKDLLVKCATLNDNDLMLTTHHPLAIRAVQHFWKEYFTYRKICSNWTRNWIMFTNVCVFFFEILKITFQKNSNKNLEYLNEQYKLLTHSEICATSHFHLHQQWLLYRSKSNSAF